MRSSTVLCFSALILVACPAGAQTPMGARNTLNDQMAYAERLQRELLDAPRDTVAAVDPDQNPRRARRAQAAAALINGGDCPGAIALAQRERDQRLLARVTEVCSHIAASAAAGGEAPRN